MEPLDARCELQSVVAAGHRLVHRPGAPHRHAPTSAWPTPTRATRAVDLSSAPEVAKVIASVESRLAGQGRLLVRYSGTEPLLRVMVEGEDEAAIRRWAEEIAEVARRHVG